MSSLALKARTGTHRDRATTLTEFKPFPRLPPELRLLIWELAIQDPIRLMVFPRNNGIERRPMLPQLWAPDDWFLSLSRRHRTRRSFFCTCRESRDVALKRFILPHLPFRSWDTADMTASQETLLQQQLNPLARARPGTASFKRLRVPVDWSRDTLHVAALNFEPNHVWMDENPKLGLLHEVQRLAIEVREFHYIMSGSIHAQYHRIDDWAEALVAGLPALRRVTLVYSHQNDMPMSLPRSWDKVGLRNEFPNICPWRHADRPCQRSSEGTQCHVIECEVVHRIKESLRKKAARIEVCASVCFMRGFDWEVRTQYNLAPQERMGHR